MIVIFITSMMYNSRSVRACFSGARISRRCIQRNPLQTFTLVNTIIVEKAEKAYAEQDATQNLHHKRYPGGHALTQERFAFITEWLEKNA